MKKLGTLYTAGGNIKILQPLGDSLAAPQKVWDKVIIWPNNLGIYPKKMKIYVHTGACRYIQSSIIRNSQNVDTA